MSEAESELKVAADQLFHVIMSHARIHASATNIHYDNNDIQLFLKETNVFALYLFWSDEKRMLYFLFGMN